MKTPREIITETIERAAGTMIGNGLIRDNALTDLKKYYVPSVEEIDKAIKTELQKWGLCIIAINGGEEIKNSFLAKAIHNLCKRK